jgi:hypothetical protein
MAETVFTNTQQSAYDIMAAMLNQYNLGSLADTLKGIISGGITDQAEIQVTLQSTSEWKRRFHGNELLKAAGVPVLSVAEYLSTERSYAQVMKNYGLPVGFYDDPDDFAKFIGTNVSPNELQQRAQMYADVARREDPAVTDQLRSMGMGEGDILAYMMDPNRALPLIQQKYQTTLLGAASRRSGLVTDNSYLSHLADLGINEQQASQGFGQIAGELPRAQQLGDIYNDQITQSDLQAEAFDGDGSVTTKKKRLASQERASFTGSAGVGQTSLRRNTSGSY